MLFNRYTNDEDGKLELNLLMQTNLNRIRRLGLVSVSLIEGFAIGGGAEVSTSTDFRVMTNSEKSYIRFIHHRLSLCPGWGGDLRLVQVIERNQALKVLLQAEKLVQLFESPVFVHVRLQLINAGSPALAPLLQSLYGLLMILPQSDAYHLLQNRLTGITPLHVIMHSCEASE